MEAIYLAIVVFLLVLAVFDLFVGVSNDAVNFLNSAIGAKVATFRTVMIIASAGVVIGAVMSAGMMDVARHGIMRPDNYSFHEVMTIFLAVMVTDVIVLDVFNSLGLPTSTTVSLVFELLGGTFVLAVLKMASDNTLTLEMLLNSDKALSVIIAIFVSVAIAFVCGLIVQWTARIVFTFNYKKHLRYTVAVFGGIAFTFLSYFIFIKGLSKSPFIADVQRQWITTNTPWLLAAFFVGSTILSEVLHLLRVNVFRVVVLMGTFALAMAFAGNDLVNFIGVPMAGLDSYCDFAANGSGNPDTFMMHSLMPSAKTPLLYLMAAGVVMIVAMCTSKKAQGVVKTSVDLSRQDEGDEMFGSSKAARSIVRATQNTGSFVTKVIPLSALRWIDSRFRKEEVIMADGAAFDMVRASVNLVLASILIIVGTNYKLPLSTTYVTFMVAMGSSLADRAWSRESAVFRITGVLSVIGGWFITAGVAFVACSLVCSIMHFGGFIVMALFMALAVFLLIRSNIRYGKKAKEEKKDDVFLLMMRAHDPEIVWDLLKKHVSRTQSFVCRFAHGQYDKILDGLLDENLSLLSQTRKELDHEQEMLKKYRRKELLAMRRVPSDTALERNTWYHLGVNSDQQYIYCLKRMLDPIREHVDNNFNPLPPAYVDELTPIRRRVTELLMRTEAMLSTGRFDGYDSVLAGADRTKDELSVIRKRHYDRMQNDHNPGNMKISLVYLNILQESQEFISIMRHQLRAAGRFYGD
ncbi:MAG: inorganic phosphate transporter [Prevotella sp.]